VSLNGQAIREISQVRSLLDKAGRVVALLIERDKAKIFVPVEIG
jgi:serine protease Do